MVPNTGRHRHVLVEQVSEQMWDREDLMVTGAAGTTERVQGYSQSGERVLALIYWLCNLGEAPSSL